MTPIPHDKSSRKASFKRSPWEKLADAWFGYDYFIAHRTQDGGHYAEALYERLTTKGNELDCFLDQKNYPAGRNLSWLQTLAIQRTSRLIVVVTPGAHDSKHVLSEVQEFKGRWQGKPVVPIGTRDTLSKERFPNSRLLPELPEYPADICILESLENLRVGPSDKTVEKLLNDFSEERQATRRIRALQVVAGILLLLLVVAVGLGWTAYVEGERRAALLREASRSDYRSGAEMIRSRRVEEAMVYLNRALDYNPNNTNAAALFGTMVLEWAKNPGLEKVYDTGSAVSLVSFSKTGRYCFSSMPDGRVICLDIAAGWRKTFELKQTYSPVIAVFSSDESRVAFASAGEVIVRQVSDGTVIGSIQRVGSGYVTCLSFNPAGSLLAVGDAQGTLEILRVERDLPVDFRNVYAGEIRQTEFSSDGSSVLISVKGAAGGSILPVDIVSHGSAGPEVKLGSAPDLIRWTHGGDKYIVLANEGLRVVRLATGELSSPIVPVQNRLQNASLVLSPDGQWLAFADYNLVRLIGVSPDGNLDQTRQRNYSHGGPVTDLRFSDDGRLLFGASRDGTGSVYDTDSASVNFLVSAPEAPMLAYLPVQKLGKAISCSEDGIFATWDLSWQGAMQMDLYPGTSDPVLAIRFDGQHRILGFTENGHLLRWDSASSEEATTIALTAGRFSEARFLCEGRLVSAIDNGHRTLRVLQGDTLTDVIAPFPLPPKTRAYCVSPGLEIFAVIADDTP